MLNNRQNHHTIVIGDVNVGIGSEDEITVKKHLTTIRFYRKLQIVVK